MVTLREVAGDREELAALRRVVGSDDETIYIGELESESILMDKVIPGRRGGGPGPAGGRRGGAR